MIDRIDLIEESVGDCLEVSTEKRFGLLTK